MKILRHEGTDSSASKILTQLHELSRASKTNKSQLEFDLRQKTRLTNAKYSITSLWRICQTSGKKPNSAPSLKSSAASPVSMLQNHSRHPMPSYAMGPEVALRIESMDPDVQHKQSKRQVSSKSCLARNSMCELRWKRMSARGRLPMKLWSLKTQRKGAIFMSKTSIPQRKNLNYWVYSPATVKLSRSNCLKRMNVHHVPLFALRRQMLRRVLRIHPFHLKVVSCRSLITRLSSNVTSWTRSTKTSQTGSATKQSSLGR